MQNFKGVHEFYDEILYKFMGKYNAEKLYSDNDLYRELIKIKSRLVEIVWSSSSKITDESVSDSEKSAIEKQIRSLKSDLLYHLFGFYTGHPQSFSIADEALTHLANENLSHLLFSNSIFTLNQEQLERLFEACNYLSSLEGNKILNQISFNAMAEVYLNVSAHWDAQKEFLIATAQNKLIELMLFKKEVLKEKIVHLENKLAEEFERLEDRLSNKLIVLKAGLSLLQNTEEHNEHRELP